MRACTTPVFTLHVCLCHTGEPLLQWFELHGHPGHHQQHEAAGAARRRPGGGLQAAGRCTESTVSSGGADPAISTLGKSIVQSRSMQDRYLVLTHHFTLGPLRQGEGAKPRHR